MDSLVVQEDQLCKTKLAVLSQGEPTQNHCSAAMANNISHDGDCDEVAVLDDVDCFEAESCDLSMPDLDHALAIDGMSAMHVSIANSIEDDRSSVEILSPTFSSHFKQAEELPMLEASVPAEKLRAMLKTQLEYYFSPENLSQDKYLLTQMDRDQWVPISIIAGFNQVKRLTHRVELVTEVLKESAVVEVDEVGHKVRPASKRRTIILREIPEGTKHEDVEALFHGDGCPKFVDCVFAHNEHWYVTFVNEEDAQRALFFLREKGRTFNGEPIKARLKAGLPLAVSTSSYVRPGQNGIVSVSSYEVRNESAATATVTIPLTAKCAYTPLPAVQYIQHPSYPFFPPPQVWPANVYIANEAALAAAAFYPAAIPTHVAPSYPAGAANVGFIGARQRPRRGSGSSFRGGNVAQAGRQQSATVDGAGNAASSGSQPPRFSRRNAEQQSSDASESMNTSSGTHVTNGPLTGTCVNQSVSASARSINPSSRGGFERTSGVTRAVASAQGHVVSTANAESTNSGNAVDVSSSNQLSHSNYGRSPGPRRGGGAYRGRRRPWNEESTSRVDQRKVREADNFELEPLSFPPLPGNSTTVVVGDHTMADTCKTLSDVVKGVGKSSITTVVDKPHTVGPALSAVSSVRHQTAQSPVITQSTNNCDVEVSAPVSSTVAIARGRVSRSTSTDNLVVVTAEVSITPTNENCANKSTPPPTVVVQNNTDESKPRAKLSYAQIAQRGKEQNDNGVIAVTQNAGVESSSSVTTSNDLSKETNQSSQASSVNSESGWKTRSSSSSSYEQRSSSNTSTSHLKNSRFPGGRGGAPFVGGDTRHRQRTYNGVATVGSSKH